MTENSHLSKKHHLQKYTLKYTKKLLFWMSLLSHWVKYNNPKLFQHSLSSEAVDFATVFEFQNISDPLSSEAVGFASSAATFEFQNIPDPLSSEAVGITTAA